MIRDMLLPALLQRFPAHEIKTDNPPAAIATLAAAHPAVGDVTIWDDGDEATVGIGNITHHHFNLYDASLADDIVAEKVTEQVIQFLELLFADRVFLQQGRSSGWGSMRILEDGEQMPAVAEDADAFLWSGPLPRR